VNILDEDISVPECEQLRVYKIHFRQIGVEIGRSGMKDREEILPLLHRLKRPTFFTLDHGFYHPTLLHQGYCLVFLDIWEDEVAAYIRRFFRHAAFRTQAQRVGKVVRVHHSGVNYWQADIKKVQALRW
jgi:hypothetical protein